MHCQLVSNRLTFSRSTPRDKRLTMIFFHRTNREAARLIRVNGFQDAGGYYMSETQSSGVWLSEEPLSEQEGARGEVLLRVTVNETEADLHDYEKTAEGSTYREWQVPAAILNAGQIEDVVE